MSFKYKSIYLDDPIQAGRAVDLFIPEAITQKVGLFFIHGGGWQMGSKDSFHKIMQAFNKEGFICCSTDYRTGKTIDLWDQLTDLRHTYETFVNELREMKRPAKIFVCGSSAGAHLGSLISLAQPGECGENLEYNGINLQDTPWTKPIGAALQAAPVLFEPWEDIFPGSWTAMERIIKTPYSESPDLYQKAAPINYVTSESCPVFHLCAEDEHMFPIRYIIEFKEKMEKMGRKCNHKIYTNAEHGFFYDITRRQQKEAFSDILKFIKELNL